MTYYIKFTDDYNKDRKITNVRDLDTVFGILNGLRDNKYTNIVYGEE